MHASHIDTGPAEPDTPDTPLNEFRSSWFTPRHQDSDDNQSPHPRTEEDDSYNDDHEEQGESFDNKVAFHPHHRGHMRADTKDTDETHAGNGQERVPFLRSQPREIGADADEEPPVQASTKKGWRQASTHLLAPFALFAAICRGMTLAPRVEVYNALTCLELTPDAVYPGPNTTTSAIIERSYPGYISFDVFPPVYLPPIDYGNPICLSSRQLPPIVEIDPSHLPEPSKACSSNPTVGSSAARLQTAISITMGLLSALSTPFWGSLSDRWGRTRVLTICALGLLTTDLVFLFVGRFRFSVSRWALVLGPVIEGATGGWTTMQAAINAYASDATSATDRAKIFSRFFGIIYVGVALGPAISGLLVKATHNLISVFYLSAASWLCLAILYAVALPESLDEEVRERKRAERTKQREASRGVKNTLSRLAEPLQLLWPRKRPGRRGRDWNVTAVACAAFSMLLVYGIYHMKFQYAIYTYGWGSEELGYYLAYIGAARAIHLLLLLPFLIRLLRRFTAIPPTLEHSASHSGNSLPIDHRLARFSVLLDVAAYSLTSLSPASAMWAFVIFTSMSSFAGGALPAMHSLALGVLTAQEKEADAAAALAAGESVDLSHGEPNHAGRLFGAFGLVQATSQILVGPVLFGALFSVTVYTFPKTIFVVAAVLLIIAFACISAVRLGQVEKELAVAEEGRFEESELREDEAGED